MQLGSSLRPDSRSVSVESTNKAGIPVPVVVPNVEVPVESAKWPMDMRAQTEPQRSPGFVRHRLHSKVVSHSTWRRSCPNSVTTADSALQRAKTLKS